MTLIDIEDELLCTHHVCQVAKDPRGENCISNLRLKKMKKKNTMQVFSVNWLFVLQLISSENNERRLISDQQKNNFHFRVKV